MHNITFNEFVNTEFTLYEGNPIIRNPLNSFVVADPSVLTPDVSHDGKWHMFCHTFMGVYRYDSEDGINFSKPVKIVPRAMRPNINRINGRYYLFYEHTKPLIGNALTIVGGKWKSEVYCTESDNLTDWSTPYLVLRSTRPFEKDSNGQNLSNPFLLKIDDTYRLYYSCGQTFIKDCGFCEPTHISFAESKNISDGYIARTKPIISPDKNIPYLNLCSGCLKVYRLADCYIGLQNGLFEEDGKSHSAIMLLRSDDGINFEFVKPFLVPQKCGSNNWMAQYVYACCLTNYNGKLRLYFNARNVSNNITGRECIGIYESK
ncbi:MAG: glycosyl hydrolase family 43 [Clostridia bacterium]|nr:glycosyl hydrolase family 43 [Clostridia bacterium]